MEKNVPTNIAICEILAGTFFGPQWGNSLYHTKWRFWKCNV